MKRTRGSVYLSILLVAAVVGACGSSSPTVPPPPTPGATLTPSLVPSAIPTEGATPTATPSATPTATPEPSPETSPSSSPTGSPGQAGSACSGTAKVKSFFADAAKHLRFDVYCAVLGPDYWAQHAEYQRPNNGWVEVEYKNARGYQVFLVEGYGCPLDTCLAELYALLSTQPSLGHIWLGDMVADLYALPVAGGPTGYFAISHPGYGLYYLFLGVGMSRSGFVKLAGDIVKVSRS
jgi:hypothetical protein